MAITPEEFFVEGLIEQSPPSPSIFLHVSMKPDGRSEGDHDAPRDMILPYISRVLMEDDIDDKISDHPRLLQVQQPFAQILSSPSFGANTDNTANSSGENALDSALSKGAGVVRAFLKGMEEANMLLPKDNGVNESSSKSGVKKRYNSDEHLEEEEEVRRTRKSVVMIKEPEDICAHEMLDDMMLRSDETYIRGMEKLRIAMAKEVEKSSRKGVRKAVRNLLDIHELLTLCAQAVATNDRRRAHELLKQIKQHASETGDATQRLAQCFAKGLEARLVGTGSQLSQFLMEDHLSIVEFLKAYNLYMAACCFNNVLLIFSRMTIMQAMVGKRRLHIVDYGMRHWFHWAGLLHLLATREGGPPEVKITAIGHPHLRPCPAEQVEEIGCRLTKCAHKFGVPFNFHAMRKNWDAVCIEDLNTDTEEVLIVNDHFNFSSLMDESIFFDDPNPKDTVLHNIRKMRPHVFIQSILNCSYGSSYLSRFREVLFYYTAIFDMFDATMPRESKSRVVLEQGLFGRYALNIIACEGVDLVERPERYRQWQARNQRAGLRKLPLEPNIVKVLKDKVRSCHHKDFFICEDDQWLLQGWMGRILFAQSTWGQGYDDIIIRMREREAK
ncbi:hypothetical protein PAHAL_8G266800 [Panicum hallii]|uniref:Uncharacterized protein n=1 Tax=Panicum hallii TaxID=206008 RepID=A0A2T8IAE3_9POAL|nr:hypothetical protein PAHAL_8G266800 [Panicum hallii]